MYILLIEELGNIFLLFCMHADKRVLRMQQLTVHTFSRTAFLSFYTPGLTRLNVFGEWNFA